MGENITSTIKRHESTAQFSKTKADREWAYAKNDKGGYHYNNAREAYAKADYFQQKADTLKASMQVTSNSSVTETEKQIGTGIFDSMAKAGGAIGGGIALVESLVSGDDFEETLKHTTSGTMKGALSGGTSEVTMNGMNILLSGLPLPLPAKAALVLGTGIFTNTVVGDIAEDFCDSVGDVVGDVVSGIADGIEDFFDSLSFFW